MKTFHWLAAALLTLAANTVFGQDVQIVNLDDGDYVHHKGFKVVAIASGFTPGEEVWVYFHIDNTTRYMDASPPYEGQVELISVIGGSATEPCAEIRSGGISTSFVSLGSLCSSKSTSIDRFTIIVDVDGDWIAEGDLLIVSMNVFTAENDPGEQIAVIAR